MDPLSVSASVAGLLAVATGIAKVGFKLAESFTGAEKEVLGLMSEVTNLIGVLHSLQFMITQFEGQEIEGTTQIYHVHSCYASLEKIKTILSKCDPSTAPRGSKSLTAFKSRAQWPLSVSETKELMQEVERHKATLSLAINADGMTALLRSLQQQDNLAEKVAELQAEANAARKSRILAALTKKRRAVLDFFGKVEPQKTHDIAVKLRHPGTGIWFTEGDEFKSWIAIDYARLWLYGILIAELKKLECEATGLAYFYCDYKHLETQIPANILGSPIRQLAIQNQLAFQDMETFWERHAPDAKRFVLEIDDNGNNMPGLPRQSTHDQREAGAPANDETLVGLLQQMSRHFKDSMIIVDGLDECGEFQGVVTRLFSTAVDPDIANIIIILTSRDEYEIRSQLNGYTEFSIAAKSSDVRLYVESEIDIPIQQKRLRLRDESLRDFMVENLISKAKGMFQWVKCQLDHLCQLPHDRARRKALETLPPTLHATYERILARVNASNIENQRLVEKVLRWVTCAKEPLTLPSIAEIVCVEDGDISIDQSAIPTEEDILHWCGSLLRKDSKENTLEPSHSSVVEFLKELPVDAAQSSYSQYSVRPENAHATLAIECVRYLSLNDFATGYIYTEKEYKDRVQKYPFLPYAVEYWDFHAIDHLEDEGLFNLMCRLFRPSKRQEFLSWSQHRAYLTTFTPDSDSFGPLNCFPENSKDVSTLHFATAMALERLVCWLLNLGSQVDMESMLVGTPLCCVAQGESFFERLCGLNTKNVRETDVWQLHQQVTTANAIIKVGANVNNTSANGRSPLWYATVHAPFSENLALENVFMKAGAICTPLIITTATNLLDARYLRCFIQLVSEENIQGEAREENRELLNTWLDLQSFERFLGENEESVSDHQKEALHTISDKNYSRIIRELARWGQLVELQESYDSDREITFMDSDNGVSPLHYAAANGHLGVVQFLMQKRVSLTAQDVDGDNPLHIACLNGHDELVQYMWETFLSRGLELAVKNSSGITPLMLAAHCCSTQTFLYILEKSDEDLSESDSEGYTILHHACAAGVVDKVKALLEKGLDATTKTIRGWTPLMVVAAKEHYESQTPEGECFDDKIFSLLIEHGCDVNCQSDDGSNILHLAIPDSINSWVPDRTGKWIQTLCKLQVHSFDCYNARRSSPLLLLVRLLVQLSHISKGTDDENDSSDGETDSTGSDIDSREVKSIEILAALEQLLECGFPVGSRRKNAEYTCLQYICKYGFGPVPTAAAQLLIKHGASRELKSSSKLTAIDYALRSTAQNIGILELLFTPVPDLQRQNQNGQTVLHQLFQESQKAGIFNLAETAADRDN